jgi:hypothetical protein
MSPVIEVEVELGSEPGEFVTVLSGMAAGRLTLELSGDELLRVLGALADLAMAAGVIPPEVAQAVKDRVPHDAA